ncbi:MAG: GNAT family N-acetyltransferase [Candidatus Woesearchaeota archaeon]
MANLELGLRDCKQEDFDWCYNLSEENMKPFVEKHWGKWDPKLFTDNYETERSKIILVDGKKAGFYEIEIRNNLGIIHGIQILPKFRGKGIGIKIMDLIENEFRNKNVTVSRLRVFIDNPARKLYERFGYKHVNTHDSYAKKGTIVMEKVLR